MGIEIKKMACPTCRELGGDHKGNNMSVYDDGSTYCWACGESFLTSKDVRDRVSDDNMSVKYDSDDTMNRREESNVTRKSMKPLLTGYFYERLPSRGISEATCEFFNYGVLEDSPYGPVHVANYLGETGEIVGQKLRGTNKRFLCTGQMNDPGLYGSWLWKPNPKLSIVVVEGELDCLSVAELQQCKWPVVSLKNGASSAVKDIKSKFEYLMGFGTIVLAFDQDEVGRRAVKSVCDTIPFPPGKLRIATWSDYKDANELLVAGKGDLLLKSLREASPLRCAGVISLDEIGTEDLLSSVLPGYSIKAFLPKMDEMLKGIRKRKIYTIGAREKAGKTTFTKEIALALVSEGVRVGLLYLEEEATEEILSLWCMVNKLNKWEIHDRLLNDSSYVDVVKQGLRYFQDKGLYIYNHKGVIDINSVINATEYMVRACDCQVIILDNLSVSLAGAGIDVNKVSLTENTVARLLSLVNNTDCTIINVVHLIKNRRAERAVTVKDGDASEKITESHDSERVNVADIYGTGAFAKFSAGVLALERDSQEDLVRVVVLRNRDGGDEGYADTLRYDKYTGRLQVVN